MTLPAFDTHAFIKKLTAAGIPIQQAEAQVEFQNQILSELVTEKLATKEDITRLEHITKEDIARLEYTTKQEIKDTKQEIKELELKIDAKFAEMKTTISFWAIPIIAGQLVLILTVLLRMIH